MCRPSAEVKNIGNVFPPNSISFGGVDCRFDGFVVRHRFGIPGLSAARNASVGTFILGISGPWICHGSTRRQAELSFFRPSSAVDIITPGFSSPFIFQKEALYFYFAVFDNTPGSCIYAFL